MTTKARHQKKADDEFVAGTMIFVRRCVLLKIAKGLGIRHGIASAWIETRREQCV